MLDVLNIPSEPVAENRLLAILRGRARTPSHCLDRESSRIPSCEALTDDDLQRIRSSSYDKESTYYNGESQRFYVRVSGGKYQVRSEQELKRFMEASGVNGRDRQNSDIIDIQINQRVDAAHPLSGHNSGPVELGDSWLLITNSPPRIAPAEGEWPTIDRFLRVLFDCDEQRQVFMQWLKLGYELIHREGHQRQSQLLCLIGANGCGKSQLSCHIIGPVLGRSGSGVELYSNTDFNASAFALELLELDDVSIGKGLGGPEKFMTQTKEALVANTLLCNPKGVNGYQVSPKWRLVMMMNHDPELLEEFPLNIAGWDDKLIMLRCEDASALLGASGEEMARFDESVRQELPAFINYLVTWECNPCYRSVSSEGTRFGVDSYKHPSLVRDVFENSKEAQLMELLMTAHLRRADREGDSAGSFRWSHEEFRGQLDLVIRERADRLVPTAQRFGVMMSRLSVSSCLRGTLDRRREGNRNMWEFAPHAEDDAAADRPDEHANPEVASGWN